MKRFIFPVLLSAATILLAALLPEMVSAFSLQEGVESARGAGTPSELFGGEGSIFTTVVNVLLFVIGALSVIMLIIGGFRYVISGGNASNVTAAKNTILYAIVGLVIAFLAFAVVNWVLGAITPGGSGGTNV